MAKGYVKTLAEQINHQSVTALDDEDAENKDMIPKRKVSGLSSSSAPIREEATSDSFVRALIQAKEERMVQTESYPESSADRDTDAEEFLQSVTNVCEQKLSKTSVSEVVFKKSRDITPSVLNVSATEAVNINIPGSEPPTVTPKKFSLSSPTGYSERNCETYSSPSISVSKCKPTVDYSSKPQIPVKKNLVSITFQNISKNSMQSPLPKTSAAARQPVTQTIVPVEPHEALAHKQNSSKSSEFPSDEVSCRDYSKRNHDHYRKSVLNTIYDNAPPLSAAELLDSSSSDSDSSNTKDSEFGDNKDSTYITGSSQYPAGIKVALQDSCHRKRFCIAQELVKTERDYVARLHLLYEDFYCRINEENHQHAFLPPDTLDHMFPNIKSIFLFHHDFLLPQLEDRTNNWESNPCLGDIMKKNAPFLKMYTEYIRNFSNALKLINQWMEKSTRFSDIIQDVQKQPACHSLSLQHHMLEPIQRVPRYELLLKDYIKNLSDVSPDIHDAEDALDLVTKAACHSNEAMKKIEAFQKLLDIYQSLRGVPVDFISPTREFVTQGPATKISARSGERQMRQIFLFNDLVLICSQYNLLGTYNVRSQLEIDSMEVKTGNNMQIPNTFLLHCKQKVVELVDERAIPVSVFMPPDLFRIDLALEDQERQFKELTGLLLMAMLKIVHNKNSAGERFDWQEKIRTVIKSHKTRKRSIRTKDVNDFPHETQIPENCLGKTAPFWIPDDAATMCMLCEIAFSMVRRRHHCRSCGKLICRNCCRKAPLEYKQGKIERVCAACYDVIVNKKRADSISAEVSCFKKKGLLQVKASEPGLISDYLQYSEDGGHSWQKLWITAHRSFVLYSFRAHEDVSAIGSLPLPGHEVEPVLTIEGRHHVFALSHKKKKVGLYQADNEMQMRRWVMILQKLVCAELPDNVRLPSQSSDSCDSTRE